MFWYKPSWFLVIFTYHQVLRFQTLNHMHFLHVLIPVIIKLILLVLCSKLNIDTIGSIEIYQLQFYVSQTIKNLEKIVMSTGLYELVEESDKIS